MVTNARYRNILNWLSKDLIRAVQAFDAKKPSYAVDKEYTGSY